MKVKITAIILLVVFSVLTLSSCGLIDSVIGSKPDTPPVGEEGSGENNKPADPEKPNPPHTHEYLDGKCQCGETDPDYSPHEHNFVDGKCDCGEEDPNYEPEGPKVLEPTTIYLVGDSTVCSFSDSYYYPRYGYGTQLANYLAPEATVVNLALSGRSSKSFITEENYQTLKSQIKAGDFLLIGFGHNDEKSDDPLRFTDATKDYTDESSFAYHLYTYYVKLALDCGATPILCTPIVRAATDDDYSGSEAHVTATGDYAKAIRDLGAQLQVGVVDLTEITKAEYQSKGFEEIKKYHAVTAGMLDSDGTTVLPNFDSVDKTHLNIYGAKFVAYSLANALRGLDRIGDYILADISRPDESSLVKNPGYVYVDYASPDLGAYAPPAHFATTTQGWYGTAFGDTGGDPLSAGNGYFATETAPGVFKVGQTAGSSKGKFADKTEGFAFLFTRVEADKNFKISVSAKILNTASTKQAGFGLMLRDDVYLPVKNSAIISNYLTAGLLCSDSSMTALFNRENGKLTKGSAFGNGLYAVDDVYSLSIERVGQSVTVSVSFGEVTATETYYDFDLFAIDGEFMYVGMFANRGTVVEFSDLSFEITGDSQGA